MGILAVFFVALAVVFGGAHAGSSTTSSGGTTVHNSGVSVALTGMPMVIFLVASLCYYLLLEARSGQTIGKRLMGVRVVSVDGGIPGLQAIALRTLGRIVDVLPAFYLVGLLAIKQRRDPRQRLGDRLANTTVADVSSLVGWEQGQRAAQPVPPVGWFRQDCRSDRWLSDKYGRRLSCVG